jgi:hypothetical protein
VLRVRDTIKPNLPLAILVILFVLDALVIVDASWATLDEAAAHGCDWSRGAFARA